MRKTAFIIFLFCWCFPVFGQQQVDLRPLYKELDAAIDSAAIFQKQKTDAIEILKKQYASCRDDEERYRFSWSLYREYVAFVSDSTLSYLQRCLELARRMNRGDLVSQSELAMAHQLSETGFYSEAEIRYNRIPIEQMDSATRLLYLSGRNHLYGEMGFYSHDPELSQQFHSKANAIRDTLLTLLPHESAAYAELMSRMLNNRGTPDEALPFSDQWLAKVVPGTRDYAIMAFFRSEIYKRKGDVTMQRYWLIQSALTDIRQAIMDQSALWSLANSIMQDDGDLDRAYRYMDFSWGCISQFSPHMRSWLVSPILTRINDKYKANLHQANSNLRWTIGAISLLAVVLLCLLFYVSKKRKQLAVAESELAAANKQLSALNGQLSVKNDNLSEANRMLSDINGQLRQAVLHLNDSNRVKDEYIGKFLSMCSDYIDKLDNYRIRVNRKLKAGQHADLLRMTGSEQLKEDELKELFDNFDQVFLHLFPTFVADFNSLLRPNEQITPAEGHRLNTDLRIFALIRLGIDESSKIAEFLHYSPNSIYAYRARIKNKAAGNRDDFERMVKEIGLRSEELGVRS